jgi:transcriptional regulator with XRE-family HTH domain
MNAYRDDLLRAEKAKLKLNNSDIAEKASLSIPTVRAVLNGDNRVIFSSVENVAKALGLTMQQVCAPKAEETEPSLA